MADWGCVGFNYSWTLFCGLALLLLIDRTVGWNLDHSSLCNI